MDPVVFALSIVFIVIGAVFLLSGLLSKYLYSRRMTKTNAVTEGIFLGIRTIHMPRTANMQLAKVRFTVEDKEYNTEAMYYTGIYNGFAGTKPIPTGTVVQVHYNPDNPKEVFVQGPGRKDAMGALSILTRVGIGFFAVGLIALLASGV